MNAFNYAYTGLYNCQITYSPCSWLTSAPCVPELFDTCYLSLVAIQNYAKLSALFAVCQVSLSTLFSLFTKRNQAPPTIPQLSLPFRNIGSYDVY